MINKNKIIVSHPTGNANVRAIIDTFKTSGILQHFYTSIATYPNNIWYKLSRIKPFYSFSRRTFNPELEDYTRTYPWKELGRLFALKTGLKSLTKHEAGIFCVDNIYKSLDEHVASKLDDEIKKGVTAVYAYEDCALETFTKAKQLGLKCIYDLPIAYWETGRKLMQTEAERLPKWAATLGGGIKDSKEKLLRKQKELELADVVVGPGLFVLDSLPEWAKSKKRIMSPFGSPQSKNFIPKTGVDSSKPLRVLFVGSMGQRKGLGDLFAAMNILKEKNANIELVVLGSMLAPMDFYKSEYPDFIYESSRPHEEVLKLMRSCDVFCLPSIVEGRALVMQEAMSQGLPLIITPNTGGEDLIIEGETGFLVPIASADSIAKKMEWFLSNRNLIPQMGINAYHLSQKYTWDGYGNTVVNDLKLYLDNSIN
jgi:glycosyltransferase involved in cell wall biosynthesis